MLTERAAAGYAVNMPGMDTSLLDEFLPADSPEIPAQPEPDDLDGWLGGW